MGEETKGTEQPLKVYFLFIAISVAVIMFLGVFNNNEVKNILKYLLYTVIIDFIIVFYINISKDKVIKEHKSWLLINICYLTSAVLLLSGFHYLKNYIWLLGVIIIANYIDMNLSFFIMYGLLQISAVMQIHSFESSLIQGILGTFLCFFSGYLKKTSNLFYVSTFIISMDLTLTFISHNFYFDEIMKFDTILSAVELLVIIFVTFLLKRIGDSVSLSHEIKWKKNHSEISAVNELHNAKSHESVKIDRIANIGDITKEDFSLIERLYNEAPTKYLHSMNVAGMSMNAAREIDADAQLAFAGGWYHEIGCIEGKEYITLGEKLAKETNFPQGLIDIIRQHNEKFELPQSEEAVIVLLSDNIVSILEYLKKTGQTCVVYEKVVENIFAVRMNQGTFDQSGITIQKYKKLKQFYIKECENLQL